MPSEVSIRLATETDIPAITDIYNEVIKTTFAIYREDAVDVSERLAWYLDKIAHNFPVLVAVNGQRVIGYGVYGTFRFGEGYSQTVEHSVHVAENFRNQGIGKKILQNLILMAIQQNKTQMVAAIDSENQISIALHAKLGFSESARMYGIAVKHGQLCDLVLMQKQLDRFGD